MGAGAAIVIFVGHMSVTIVLWPVHVFMTYNSIARLVFIALLNSVVGWSRNGLHLGSWIKLVFNRCFERQICILNRSFECTAR